MTERQARYIMIGGFLGAGKSTSVGRLLGPPVTAMAITFLFLLSVITLSAKSFMSSAASS